MGNADELSARPIAIVRLDNTYRRRLRARSFDAKLQAILAPFLRSRVGGAAGALRLFKWGKFLVRTFNTSVDAAVFTKAPGVAE
jgi:hypothetical protein